MTLQPFFVDIGVIGTMKFAFDCITTVKIKLVEAFDNLFIRKQLNTVIFLDTGQ